MADTPDDFSDLMPPSWLQEYYPTPAAGAATLPEAIAHSLRKWEGLLAGALVQHNVTEAALDEFVSSDSCALCQLVPKLTERVKHKPSVMQTLQDYQRFRCIGCPLVQVRGTSCDLPVSVGIDASPWDAWHWNGDPEPMISLLKLARDEYKDGV